jgi:hypothetical protein
VRGAFQTQAVDELLQGFAGPGLEDPMEMEGRVARDGGQTGQVQGICQMGLDMVHHPVHAGSVILTASGGGGGGTTLDATGGTVNNSAGGVFSVAAGGGGRAEGGGGWHACGAGNAAGGELPRQARKDEARMTHQHAEA